MEQRGIRDQVPLWIAQMRQTASKRPGTGACAVATGLELWAWTFNRLHREDEAAAASADAAAGALAEALGWLMAARALVLDVSGPDNEGAPDAALRRDACHGHVARTCGEVSRICAELVFGFLRHPGWQTDAQHCYHASDLDMIEEYVPGLAASARAYSDVIEADGSHPAKAGPCVRFDGLEEFVQLRTRLDGCLAGGAAARRRAADALKEGSGLRAQGPRPDRG
ncbi:MAG: hypothetical protein ACM3NQ_01020 [Bacteroidales bacterium]